MTNRVVMVMGGTTGLGLSAALALRAAGARVVVVGRNPANVAEAGKKMGDEALALEGDASDPQTAQRAVEAAVTRFGRLDGLYHVAGGSGRSQGDGPLHELSDEGVQYTLAQNLTGAIYSNRAAVRQFLAQGQGGTILNMTSVLAFSPSPRYFATHVYAAAKAAIIGLTRSCAAYYAKNDIRFNAIAPALVDTPMAQRATQNTAIQNFVAHKQPLDGGRIGRPEDLDAAVVFFLSDASRFVTGQVLSIDGGWTVSEGEGMRG